jgi:hypothetical protein
MKIEVGQGFDDAADHVQIISHQSHRGIKTPLDCGVQRSEGDNRTQQKRSKIHLSACGCIETSGSLKH